MANESATDLRSSQARPARLMRYGLPAAILLVLIGGFLAYRARTIWQAPTSEPAAARLSESELEERHGLRVRLIGVTAGGGMIDFRLKILDVEKARQFLQDPAHLPRLIVADSGMALVAPEGIADDVAWTEGGILFVLFPNSGGAIKPGTAVIVEFGSVQLEPVLAQ